MTPADAAARLDKLSPAFVKLTLVELLEWQAAHGKSIINLGWYLNCMFFKDCPQEKRTEDATAARRRVEAMVRKVGATPIIYQKEPIRDGE